MARKTTKRKVVDMSAEVEVGEVALAVSAPAGPVVIKLVGLVSGAGHPLDGQYVTRYHPGPPSMRPRECLLLTTRDVSRAKVYASALEAHAEWTRVDEREPVRADGQPNRPMTAWSIFILTAPAQE